MIQIDYVFQKFDLVLVGLFVSQRYLYPYFSYFILKSNFLFDHNCIKINHYLYYEK